MPAFENLLVDFASIYTNILKYIDLNQTLDIQDFIQNGIVVNNYTQEQNFTLFYHAKQRSGYHENMTALYQEFLSCIDKNFDMF